MTNSKVALILIGFQNDYFSENGILSKVIEASAKPILCNTLALLEGLTAFPVTIVSTPIMFTSNYSELDEPIGILKTIKGVGAFKAGTDGARTISEFKPFESRIIEVPGKKGLNAFSNTKLDQVLEKNGIETIALAGVVTSICIDSTARSAHEKGYKVQILSDCVGARTRVEQDFYLEQVFPIYARITDSKSFLKQVSK